MVILHWRARVLANVHLVGERNPTQEPVWTVHQVLLTEAAQRLGTHSGGVLWEQWVFKASPPHSASSGSADSGREAVRSGG